MQEFFPQESYAEKNRLSLHKYGEGAFCRFSIHPKWNNAPGVYAFFINDDLAYIGQCVDFAARINLGYGRISPRNCYTGGQSTNCKINKLVLNAVKEGFTVVIYFHNTSDYDEVESKLIAYLKPSYNWVMRTNRRLATQNNLHIRKEKQPVEKISIQSTNNPNTEEVRDYIRCLITTAQNQGEHHLILKSGDVHKDLNMKNGMPTVCSAMRSLDGLQKYEVVEQPPKGNGSRLILKYLL